MQNPTMEKNRRGLGTAAPTGNLPAVTVQEGLRGSEAWLKKDKLCGLMRNTRHTWRVEGAI
jgi:hypothetical protein